MPHAPSYYAATAHDERARAQLVDDVSAELVVVGGGFTGLSTALAAAEAGMSVVLLEAQRVGWGASGRNGGQMIPGMRWGAAQLVAAFGRERGRELIRLGLDANAAVRRRIARHAIACDLAGGHFEAAWKPAHLDDMAREKALLEDLVGYDSLRLVTQGEVAGVVATDRYHGGLFDSAGGHLHPLNYALGLARAAEDAGVRIFEGSAVTAMDHEGPIVARTAKGRVKANRAVLACDADIGALEPKLGRAMMPVVNYNIATAPLGEARARALIPSLASIAESRFVLNYYRLSADNRLIFGGGEKYTPRPPRDIAGFVQRHMLGIFPQLGDVAVDYAWGGTIGVTMNRLPRFGRIGRTLYAHGWSGHGVLLTTLAGEVMAEALAGDTARFDLFASLPERDFPGGALLRHPLHVAGMLWYAMRDRL